MIVDSTRVSFAEKLNSYLQIADYKAAVSEDALAEIFKLRYESYLTGDAILPNPARSFRDVYDDMDNCWNFGVYINDSLVSAVRFHVLTSETPYGPACDFYPDIVMPMLEQGMVLIDPSRLVSDPDVRKTYREIPYATVRVPAMAYEHFEADYSLASVRKEHQAFYRRVFNAEKLSDPRPYPPLTVRLSLMKLRLDQSRDDLLARYPIFASSLTERRLMFNRPDVQTESPAVAPDTSRIQPRLAS